MKKLMKRSLVMMLSLAMMMSMFTACGKEETSVASTSVSASVASTSTSTEVVAEPEKDDILVVGYSNFSSKFSPFFAASAYDQDVASMVSLGLLGTDREGNVILNGIEGEVVPYNGTEYTYTGIADCKITENADGTIVYDFTMRDDVKFSDGTPMTADDVIFSMYVLCDPTYDGASTLNAQPIKGMEEYRSGMSVKGDLIFAAGPDNTDNTYFTADEQSKYWNEAIAKGGEAFAQDIVDFVMGNYATSYADYLAACGNSDVAFGMMMWGFGDPSDDGKQITGAGTGTVYDTASVTAADYWTEIEAAYEGDYQSLSDTEAANNSLCYFINELYPEFAAGVVTGDSAANIAGIEKTGDYSVRITMDSFDAVSIYQLPVTVAPMHYYGDASQYDYANNKFGFTKGDLSGVKSKTTQPLGAGPYKFVSYENGVVTFAANENYFKGCPKIEYVQFKETPDSDKLTGVASGAFDVSDPSMSLETLKSIKGYNANGEIQGETITTSLVDNLGYGYIGINSKNVSVGGEIASDASKNLRKAFATLFAAYRDTVINSYYGEMATVIQYPISNTSWAAPKPADEGYAIAFSKDVEGNSIYTADMTEEQKAAAALDAAVGFLKAAGFTYDEAAGKFTAAPEGAEMTYEFMIPADGVGNHPVYGVITATKEALASVGITLEINDLSNSSKLWDDLDAGTVEMWAAAWGATVDPDMYQVYHSDNALAGTRSNHYGIKDAALDELIVAARESADQSYRKATYKNCLGIILDWAVEVPTYQRQNAVIFSTERVNMETVTPDITTFWGWMNDLENLEMN